MESELDVVNSIRAKPGVNLIQLKSPTCARCHPVSDAIDELLVEFDFKTYQVNVHDHPDVAVEFGVTKLPAIVLFFEDSTMILQSVTAQQVETAVRSVAMVKITDDF